MVENYWSSRELIPATKKELKRLFDYEVWMFRETCKRIALVDWHSKPKSDEQFNRNLLLESLAIHTRILYDFFKNKKMYANDVIAQDLLEKIDWGIEKSDILEEASNKADKQLAHLSRWRIKIEKDGKKDWDFYVNIKKDMEKLIESFEKIIKI